MVPWHISYQPVAKKERLSSQRRHWNLCSMLQMFVFDFDFGLNWKLNPNSLRNLNACEYCLHYTCLLSENRWMQFEKIRVVDSNNLCICCCSNHHIKTRTTKSLKSKLATTMSTAITYTLFCTYYFKHIECLYVYIITSICIYHAQLDCNLHVYLFCCVLCFCFLVLFLLFLR